jgi:hypothetical protein
MALSGPGSIYYLLFDEWLAFGIAAIAVAMCANLLSIKTLSK